MATLSSTAGDAAEKGWVERRARIAENWTRLATECQELALEALHSRADAVDDHADDLSRRLRVLGGNSPLKALITSAAIATDKALLMANEATERNEIVQGAAADVVRAGFEHVSPALAEHGPWVQDPVLDGLFEQMEQYLLTKDGEIDR